MKFYLNSLYENILLFIHYTNYYHIIGIFLFLLQISLILLYLTDFSLFNIRVIKYVQIIFLFTIPLFVLLIYFLFIYDNAMFSNIVYSIDDLNKNNSGVNVNLEANNVTVNGIEVAVGQIRDSAVYIGGMAVAGKVVRSSSLPIGAKLGAAIGIGAASLIGYKMIENNLSYNRAQDGMIIKVDKVSAGISNNNDSFVNKLVAGSGSSDESKDYLNISSLDVEQLQLDLYLHVVILYLLIIVIVFLIMKSISDRDLEFSFLHK